MPQLQAIALVLVVFPIELLSIQVSVPETERRTTLFASVLLRCDYSTTANTQDVLVTWRFKSFCLDPVLEYYSTAYQAALALKQDPANDCQDSQRTVRTVIQKRGMNEATLGPEYRDRKIYIQNNADLVINEVMWWDNGMYFCSIDAAGDVVGDSDKEIRLIVYHWLTVMLIILGALLLIILFGVCCCQCCPQNCCCYVRCPCCPRTCCCPEEAVMHHRMMRDAKKAMVPWFNGQPIYAPIASNPSSQGNPLLYSGSFSEPPSKHNYPMGPMAMPPPQTGQHFMPPHGYHTNASVNGSGHGNKQMLEYLENQVRGMEVAAPMLQPQHHTVVPLQNHQPQYMHQPSQAVSYPARAPSMLSALDEMGVQGVERRVIQLPPIVGRARQSSRRANDGARGKPRQSRQSSGSSNRNGNHRDDSWRGPATSRREIPRSYSDESDWGERRGSRGSSGRRGGSGSEWSRPQARSKGELLEELERANWRDRSYSPAPRRNSWSSDEDNYRKETRSQGKLVEKPPDYSTIDILPGHSRRNDQFSEKSSRSGRSVVI
ncbi:immunoglobulin-like domain-containing receptor 1b [Triplophysa dalaica]|uniref:immunoglobulin-like domain-containing receptor 1b n=1 Tax=Triplophysa dalaica TaxID=1582913 RepID=UPI0024E010EF|nr:immunoglobulin-like domain-containing receptor 1b [Triplophysa dalaica]XP_056611810.1 immunoglobulin-like domain-containing receptor 1b [Triplophysa dalaica]